MPMQLTINLSDEQVALMAQAADRIIPGSTNAQKIAWAQGVAKVGLRSELQRIVLAQIDDDFDARWAEHTEALEAARLAVAGALDRDWPESLG